ncbi:MAG TPA: TrkA C-terminal domain-containing protein, partial [Vicinamibacteria bacterium]|nr:TrkA C-terminal domain-containing protein [Vicinamibacteria bacterium]
EGWRGRRVGELVSGADVLAVAFTRAGRSMLPAPDMVLEPGDIVHVSATLSGIEALRERAVPPGGPR